MPILGEWSEHEGATLVAMAGPEGTEVLQDVDSFHERAREYLDGDAEEDMGFLPSRDRVRVARAVDGLIDRGLRRENRLGRRN